MNRDHLPETPAELHDLLQTMFGIGTYDDIASPMPWFRARMTEIAKLKAMLRKRRTTIAEVAVAAWYAHDKGLPVPGAWRLFELIPEAKRAARETDRTDRESGRLNRRNNAVIEAMEANEQAWADRLISASDRDIDAVLDQWRNR